MNFKLLQAMQAKLEEAILQAKPEMTAEERFNKTLCEASVAIAKVYDCCNTMKVDRVRFEADWNYGSKQIIGYYDTDKDYGNSISIEQAHRLTLVGECSDCLHFILSLANQLESEIKFKENNPLNEKDDYYLVNQLQIQVVQETPTQKNINTLASLFLSYIQLLDITTEELEQAYYEKNKVNYERLESGY